MKENIETKDVQRTEYLDKNGLDMLWAKVKENVHNQVEVERNRATTQENRIIDTKADKSELHSSYVSNSTFTALQEKVAANTDAISDKQDVGNYLSYETLNNEGYYEIPDIRIPGSDGSTKTDIDSQSISVNCDYPASHTTITCDGISNTDNNANHVYATDGSIADLTQYAKKSESVDNTALTALEQKITANTAAISNKQDAGNYIPYELYNNESYGEFYKIPKNIAFQDDDSSNGYITMIEPMGILVYRNRDKSKVQISSTSIRFDIENGGHMYLGKGLIQSSSDKFDQDFFQLDKNGITLRYGTNDEVLTSAGSTINITRYALKSELPTVPTKVSELQNDSNFTTESYVTQNFAYKNTVNNTIENLQQSINRLDSNKQNKITPGNLNISALNSQNTIVTLKNTIMDLIDTLEKSGVITVTRS